MKNLRSLAVFLVVMAFVYTAPPALAIITSGTAAPAQINVPSNAPAVRNLTWTLNYAGNIGPVTLRSDQALVLLNGEAVHVISRPLSRTDQNNGNFLTFTFPETITLPHAVVVQAIKTGGALTLRRVFTEEGPNFTRTIDVPVQVISSLTGDFAVTRISLSFPDGSSTCAMKNGKLPRVVARIESAGTGMLRGEWQVREGGSLGSFRTLRMVQTPVTSGMAARLESPEVPLQQGTRYDLRLLVRDPVLGFVEPIITCMSERGQAGMLSRTSKDRDAAVIAPLAFSPLNDATVIRWKAVPSAKAYRIDVLVDQEKEPVASQMAKGNVLETKLSPLTLDKLDPKTRYSIRVIAQP